MSRVITVFGATGVQGGSVVRQILADPTLSAQFKIRAITRDINKPAAQALIAQNVEVATANLNSKDSVATVLRGAHSVFLVTNFWETGKAAVEIQQGMNVADAAKEAGVSHLIFSSLKNVNEMSAGKFKHMTHFDSKAYIEQYMRDSGVPSTFVMAGYYMSNFVHSLRKGSDDVYTLSLPIATSAQFPLLDTSEDIGKFVVAALKDPKYWSSKHILAASGYYTAAQILAEFEKVTGKKTHYNKITPEQYKNSLPPVFAFAAEEFLENHLLLEGPGYFGGEDLEPSLAALGSQKPNSWEQFVAKTAAWK